MPLAGGLVSLTRKWADGRQGAQWATQDTPLGRLMYSTYTEADYEVIWDQYQYVSKDADWWFRKDFGKANLDNSVATNRSDTFATVQGMWAKQVCAPGAAGNLTCAFPTVPSHLSGSHRLT